MSGGGGGVPRDKSLKAEITRLKAQLDKADDLYLATVTENEKLREALTELRDDKDTPPHIKVWADMTLRVKVENENLTGKSK